MTYNTVNRNNNNNRRRTQHVFINLSMISTVHEYMAGLKERLLLSSLLLFHTSHVNCERVRDSGVSRKK